MGFDQRFLRRNVGLLIVPESNEISVLTLLGGEITVQIIYNCFNTIGKSADIQLVKLGDGGTEGRGRVEVDSVIEGEKLSPSDGCSTGNGHGGQESGDVLLVILVVHVGWVELCVVRTNYPKA